jgi:D-amino acid aminotransferase
MRVLFNGDLIEEKDAVLPVSDKAVWFDFGVYESIKVVGGRAFYPEKHVERFFQSGEIIGLELGVLQKAVLDWIDVFIESEKLDNALLRMLAYGDAEKNERTRIYIFALGLTFYPHTFYSEGTEAITYVGERFLPESKSFNLLMNFLAFREAQKKKAIEALLIDRDGFVTEGTRSNVFIVEKNQVVTPPAGYVLNGVTRDLLLGWASERDIVVKEEKVRLERLFKASEVFITSTGMNVMPVVRVDGKVIGNGNVGEVTRKLYLLFRERQREYFKK